MSFLDRYLVTVDAKPSAGVVHFFVWANSLDEAMNYAAATITERDMSYLAPVKEPQPSVVRCRYEWTAHSIEVYDDKDNLWFRVEIAFEDERKAGDTKFLCYLEDQSVNDKFTYRNGYLHYGDNE